MKRVWFPRAAKSTVKTRRKIVKTIRFALPGVYAIAAALGFLSAPTAVLAQSDYPNRPVRLITPAAPGGTTDILARLVGAKLGEVFKHQVIVDNRASASGVIA